MGEASQAEVVTENVSEVEEEVIEKISAVSLERRISCEIVKQSLTDLEENVEKAENEEAEQEQSETSEPQEEVSEQKEQENKEAQENKASTNEEAVQTVSSLAFQNIESEK